MITGDINVLIFLYVKIPIFTLCENYNRIKILLFFTLSFFYNFYPSFPQIISQIFILIRESSVAPLSYIFRFLLKEFWILIWYRHIFRMVFRKYLSNISNSIIMIYDEIKKEWNRWFYLSLTSFLEQ